ncbi:MAG: RIP metalloprotease [Clostridia bacterium]|nr:RIP metalloprotease [Clostridia bacterium]
MNILYILSAILLLGILVAAHEWGHFISARALGIAVDEFSIGFGPKLLGWKSRKHDTAFSLRLIPMGGYCAFHGEDDREGAFRDDSRAYAKQPVWKRMISVLMGPGMNFILALAVLMAYYLAAGVPSSATVEPYLSQISPGSPAAIAGLAAEDVITRVNGVDVLDGTADTLLDALRVTDGETPIALTVRRGGEERALTIDHAEWNAGENRYMIGVVISQRVLEIVRAPVSIGEALRYSWDDCVYAGGAILRALKGLVTTGEGFEDTSGPVGVISIVSEQVASGGLDTYLELLAVISINLGLMNLLPIPGLDGSRFLFMLLEAIRRKPIAPEKEAMVHLAGMVFLFGVMIVFTFRDVMRLFGE